MMKNKTRRIAMVTAILTIATLVTVVAFHRIRHEQDVFMEMIIFPGGSCRNNIHVYRFVVRNDGVFTSYYGISRNHCDFTRNVVRFFWRRARVTLSEQEFQTISELTHLVAENYNTIEGAVVFGRRHVTLLYDGRIFGRSTAFIGELDDLVEEIERLSPLIAR